METQQAFVDMSKKEIKEIYGKDENNFNVTVGRMLKALKKPGLKFKKDNEIWIKAEGVEWLHNHWRKPFELQNHPEMVLLKEKTEHQEEMISILKAQIDSMKELYRQQLETELEKQKLQLSLQSNEKLLELKEKETELEEAKKEIERLKNRNLLQRIMNN